MGLFQCIFRKIFFQNISIHERINKCGFLLKYKMFQKYNDSIHWFSNICYALYSYKCTLNTRSFIISHNIVIISKTLRRTGGVRNNILLQTVNFKHPNK